MEKMQLLKVYYEVCEEAGLMQSTEGLRYFTEVMYEDYKLFCKEANQMPNIQQFKEKSITIAKGMKAQAM